MYAAILKKVFDAYVEAPLSVWQTFTEYCEEISLPKNTIIKKAHAVEKKFYFIVKGMCGIFLWHENYNVCLDIVAENNFFAEYISLITQKPTALETMTLEATTILSISKQNIDELKQTQWGNTLFLVGTEQYFIGKQAQQINLLTKTAEQRYKDLLSKYPELLQRVAQKHIASYLGITTQSLSRIRNKIRF